MAMVVVEVVAFPLLLLTSYVVYRLGRRKDGQAVGAFDGVRLAFQGGLLGVMAATGVRLVAAGALELPLGMSAPVLAVTGITGLIASDLVDLARRRAGATSTSAVVTHVLSEGRQP